MPPETDDRKGTVSTSNHADSHRPQEDEDDRQPTIVKYGRAPRRGPEPVSVRLDRVVGGHNQDRQNYAQHALNDNLASTLSGTRRYSHMLGVEDSSCLSKDACNCPVRGHGAPNVEFHFNVTKDLPVPPTVAVFRRPYDCIDKILHVQDRNSEDENRRCKVSSPEMDK